MIEKVFGRKSTGIVHIVCTALIVLALIDYALMYILNYTESLMGLIGYALLCAITLTIITLPVLLQKKFKLYIPVFVELSLCIFVVVYLINDMLRSYFLSDLLSVTRTMTFVSFVPVLGGSIIAMTVFAVIYSALDYQAGKNEKRVSSALTALYTFIVAALVINLWQFAEYLIHIVFFKGDPAIIPEYLKVAGYYTGGAALFSIIGGVQVRLDAAGRYRIESFRDAEKAKEYALQNNNKGLSKVIDNNEKDDIDYRKIFLSAKSKFLFGKILYYALYAAYLVYLTVYYYRERLINIALIIALIAAFAVSICLSVYEYILFRRKAVTRALHRLKIAKGAIRVIALGLTISVLFQADYAFSEVTALVSAAMIIVNLIVIINNVRKEGRLEQSG